MNQPLCPKCGHNEARANTQAFARVTLRGSRDLDQPSSELEVADVRYSQPTFSPNDQMACTACDWIGTFNELLPTSPISEYTPQQKALVANALAERFRFLVDITEFAPEDVVQQMERFFEEMGGDRLVHVSDVGRELAASLIEAESPQFEAREVA